MDIEYQFHGLANHTLAALNPSGTLNAAFSYSPFGEVLETVDAGGASGTAAHRRRFNDKHQDGLSDLDTDFSPANHEASTVPSTL